MAGELFRAKRDEDLRFQDGVEPPVDVHAEFDAVTAGDADLPEHGDITSGFIPETPHLGHRCRIGGD